MRFVVFSAQYLPTVGGVERYTDNLAHALTDLGHEVTVVTSLVPGTAAHDDTDGIEVVRLRSWLGLAGRFPVPRPGRAYRRAMARVLAPPVDLVVINTRFWVLSLWAARRCARRGLPAVVIEHGTGWLTLGNPVVDIAVRLYERLGLRWVRRFDTPFYAVSKEGTQWLRQLGVAPAGVLSNAVDTARLQAATSAPGWNVRSDLGIAPDAALIAFVGRIIPEKGIRELVEAMDVLHQMRPDAALVAAGDGPLLEDLKAACPQCVHFTGPLDHDRSVRLVAQSDVLCLPTYSEGFATVVLEAAAVGTPVVTTPTGGTLEIVVDDDHGVLLDDLDPTTIASALDQVLDNPQWLRRAGELSQARVEAEFTWQHTGERLVAAALDRR
ncbi:MAG: glycosyltransferase family 4 protein [Micrococcales bacterium]|nr:glycosyltransferase family 4 protein [Micrococcales bacterium]MCL2668518.1 glycosyltransferase family 4 protein [Micrococcales bacterium]